MKVEMNNLIYKTSKILSVILQKIYLIQQTILKINKMIQIINQKIKQENMNNKFTIKIKNIFYYCSILDF